MLKKALWMIFIMKKLSQTVHDHFISILLYIYIYIYFLYRHLCVYVFMFIFSLSHFYRKRAHCKCCKVSRNVTYVCFPPHPRGLAFRYHSTRGHRFMVETGMNRELTVACNNGLQANIAATAKIIMRSKNSVFVTAVALAGRKEWMMILFCWWFLVQSPPSVCYLPFLHIRTCIHTLSFCDQR
jgi:hypothetical protein